MRVPPPVYTNPLRCVQCGRVSRENERAWTARLTVDAEVVVYCPECGKRESAVAGRGLKPTTAAVFVLLLAYLPEYDRLAP
jgi:hypothetical protein